MSAVVREGMVVGMGSAEWGTVGDGGLVLAVRSVQSVTSVAVDSGSQGFFLKTGILS